MLVGSKKLKTNIFKIILIMGYHYIGKRPVFPNGNIEKRRHTEFPFGQCHLEGLLSIFRDLQSISISITSILGREFRKDKI